MPRVMPANWMPDCRMERIITHWTAGRHQANIVDREHYHVLVEGDGRLVRGDHPIDDNVGTADDNYAAHTRALNTGSIGVAVCCMAGAIQKPFQEGKFPMTRTQYRALALVVADLCERYQVEVSPPTVLGHGEVERILSVPQRNKWDPMLLPWDPEVPTAAVGDAFREQVRAALTTSAALANLSPLTVVVDGRVVSDEGIAKGATSWCPLRPLAEALGWAILRVGARSALLRTAKGDRQVIAMIRGDRGYVNVRDLCARLGWDAPTWDRASHTVTVVTA